jgi:hypothetical protein
MSKEPALTTVFAFLACILLTGCGPGTTTPLAATDPMPPTSTPTTAPPAPSETATVSAPAEEPTVDPTATFSPEIVATKPEDIAGVWLVKNFVGQGGMVRFPADLTFREDGTFSFDEIDDPMHIFGGTLVFAEGKVTFDSENCYDEAKALFYHCTMTFTIFSTMQADKPVRIRLEADRNTGVFIVNLKGKNLMLDKP